MRAGMTEQCAVRAAGARLELRSVRGRGDEARARTRRLAASEELDRQLKADGDGGWRGDAVARARLETGRLQVLRSGQRARCEDGDGRKAERGAPGRSRQPPHARAVRASLSPRRHRFLPRASPRVLCKPPVLKTKQWKSERRSECDNKSSQGPAASLLHAAAGMRQALALQRAHRRAACEAEHSGIRAAAGSQDRNSPGAMLGHGNGTGLSSAARSAGTLCKLFSQAATRQ